MKNLRFSYILNSILLIFCVLFSFQFVNAQKMSSLDRDRMEGMLDNIKKTVKKEYYDPKFHGIDIDARFEAADKRLDQVETVGQAMGVIAQALMEFNDSHLYFLPPATNIDVEYGCRLKMYGDKCFVHLVKPKSDAAKKGLKPGDQVISIEGFRPSRSELWKMMYYYNVLSKRTKLKMTVLSPGDKSPRELEIESDIDKKQRTITRETFYRLFDQSGKTAFDYNLFVNVGNISVWKMPSFSIDPNKIDVFVGKVRGSSGLILDLRGNGGGYVVTLERLAGYMFDKDLKIASLVGREEMDPQRSKTKGDDIYKGKLIVLVDHDSGSAAEIFARLVQLEKRGIVLGDVSAGAVMQSKPHIFTVSNITYGVSITNADVIMSDGKSLERTGVVPNEIVLLTGEDIAKQSDPVLARAIELLGGNVSAEQAGKFFQYEWEKDGIQIKTK